LEQWDLSRALQQTVDVVGEGHRAIWGSLGLDQQQEMKGRRQGGGTDGSSAAAWMQVWNLHLLLRSTTIWAEGPGFCAQSFARALSTRVARSQ